ncbi:MAG: PIG-L deacetylase family protein [candidate division FCPU426 bacterium]
MSKAPARVLRVLVIGAHPDDCEFQAGGTAAKFARAGHIVRFVSATNGDTGHHSMTKSAVAKRRAAESRRSCALIGAQSEILPISSNSLEADLPTRRKFIALIRRFKPDLLFTHRTNDYHPDHRRTGILVQDSSYAIRVPKVVPGVPALSRPPLIVYLEDAFQKPSKFQADVVVDLDEDMDTKIRMLDAHVSQVYEWLPWIDGEADQVPVGAEKRLQWLGKRLRARQAATAQRFRDKLVKAYGKRGKSIRHAEAFEISEYGAKLGAEGLKFYFPFLGSQ